MIDDLAAIDLLERFVRTPSESGHEAEFASVLVDVMSRSGFDARIDEVGNVVGLIGSGDGCGVLLGHIDTVPGQVPVRREGTRLYGRGSVDAKGPLTAFVVAAARAHARGVLGSRVIVVGCVEEEAASSKGARHVAPLLAPDWCVVGEPSGWDGITLGYKGCVRARVTFDQERGHNAHDRFTACERAVETWNHLVAAATAMNADRTRLFDQVLPHLIAMQGGQGGTDEHAELAVDLRLPPDFDPSEVPGWLGSFAEGARVVVEGGVPAWSGPRTTPLHRALGRAIAEEGGRATWKLKTGTADLNIVAPAWECPALAYGPGDAALDHTPDEHIELDEFLKGISVLERLLERMSAP